jgi:predicted nucleic acid-binding protein
MSARVFVDTNILVYAHDIDAGQKRQTAKDVLKRLLQEQSGAVSMQVLQEFYNTVTRKLASPLSKADAREIVDDFSHWCVTTTPEEIRLAFRIEDEATISFWDALIIAAAVKSGAARVLSEDMNHGQRIAGVLVVNPFAA